MQEDAPSNQNKMAAVGDKLFKRSTLQSANLEKAVKNLQEILKNIEQNSENAESIADLAENSKDEVLVNKEKIVSLKHLFEVIKQFQTNLTHISSLVFNIRDKTDFLEAIALKSEKLSYNAEVEAARSGENSARFSVIAEEIRNLTTLNRSAASDISGIVEECVSTVDGYSTEIKHTLQEGHIIVGDVEGAFQRIETEISTMVTQSKGITSESQYQLQATKKVNESVKNEVENYSSLISELLEDLTGSKIIDLTCEQAAEILHEFTIIDVRGETEYLEDLGSIEESINLPINNQLESALEGYDRNSKYLFVCRSGGRSTRAARLAQGIGFKNVYNLQGGMLKWNAQNLPKIPPVKAS